MFSTHPPVGSGYGPAMLATGLLVCVIGLPVACLYGTVCGIVYLCRYCRNGNANANVNRANTGDDIQMPMQYPQV